MSDDTAPVPIEDEVFLTNPNPLGTVLHYASDRGDGQPLCGGGRRAEWQTVTKDEAAASGRSVCSTCFLFRKEDEREASYALHAEGNR